MNYHIRLTKRADKELRRLPADAQQQVRATLKKLAIDPRPAGSAKLSGLESHRVRSGDYRIVYDVDDTQQTIEIWRIQHRKDVYRDL